MAEPPDGESEMLQSAIDEAAFVCVGSVFWCSFGGSLVTMRVLVAEWIHFTLFGITLPTIKLKVYTLKAYELSN